MKRYNHNRSNSRFTSFDMGVLVPTCARHSVAGTTLRGGVSGAFRLSSMVHQSLTSVRIDTFAIAGADRILWPDAEKFYTGGSDGNQRPEPPYIKAPAEGWAVGSLADHLGFPTGVPNLKCSALPFRLYAYWWNEYIRDPVLQDPLPISFESGEDTITNTELQRMNWQKDIFTTAVSEPQLGDEVVVPIATSVGVSVTGNYVGSNINVVSRNTAGTFPLYGNDAGEVKYNQHRINGEITQTVSIPNQEITSTGDVDLSQATGVLPSDFNFAMAQQAWKTKRNLFGSAFRDWLAFLGIRYSDRRLQLPQTLAHGRGTVDINGVLQTAPATGSYVGDMGGTGTGFGSCFYKTYYDEPYTTIHMVCLRPATLYVNIQPMEWMFQVREDIYTPEFAHVGMAELKNGVLNPTGTASDDKVWGYMNRYDEYRSSLNDVSGTMKTTQLSYHQGRVFESQVSLNSDFLECNPSPRIFNDMEHSPQIEAAAIRNTFVERNMVSPNGNPRFR